MLNDLIFYALLAVDAALIFATVVFGWRPLRGVLGKVWKHILRFGVTFLVTVAVLVVAIPWIDIAFYVNGIVLPNGVMIFIAPAVTLITALTAGLYMVWRAEHGQ